MNDNFAQLLLAIFGVSAIILVARKNRWGFVLGLLSEPFWLYTSYIHMQWGIFLLSIVYAVSWTYGIYQWFRTAESDKGKVK